MKHCLDADVDHRHLNDVLPGQPSAEAIARFVYEWCRSQSADAVAGGSSRSGPGRRRGLRRVPAMSDVLAPATLAVCEVFGPTFQGEGPSLGRRAAFVRLGRCNLDCGNGPGRPGMRYPVHLGLGPVRPDTSSCGPSGPPTSSAAAGDDGRRACRGHRRRAAAPAAPAACPFCVAARRAGWPVEVETNGTMPRCARSPRPCNELQRVAEADRQRGAARPGARPDALGALRDSGRAVFKFVVADPRSSTRSPRSPTPTSSRRSGSCRRAPTPSGAGLRAPRRPGPRPGLAPHAASPCPALGRRARTLTARTGVRQALASPPGTVSTARPGCPPRSLTYAVKPMSPTAWRSETVLPPRR